ncbi:RHS repeat-associated core domain-containing protein [Clostridium paridis]|nr:RHS repeat-associated core domain-containing protein [Clostridium paridis]
MYFYVKILQGDIIGLVDTNGTQVVSYSYDSWGKLVSIDGTLKDTLGVKNPYRFRVYRYDTETGMYYLNSRYYNPDWGRFINADGLIGAPGELLSCNMFAYCKNNPVNAYDPDGYSYAGVLELLLGAAEELGGILLGGLGALAGVGAILGVGLGVVIGDIICPMPTVHLGDGTRRIHDNKPKENNDSNDDDNFGIPSSDTPTASQLREHAKSKGWKKEKSETGPEKWIDENDVPRITIKKGSPRTKGSENPHVEIRDPNGQRTDRFGNPVSKRSPENHTPIKWDISD